jgi:excinuclease UvrABC nuclease subunit
MNTMENITFAEIKDKLDQLEKWKTRHNKACLNYYRNNLEKMKEYQRLKSKEYYDKNKNDPAFLQRKLQNTLKSLEKKKAKQNENEEVAPTI